MNDNKANLDPGQIYGNIYDGKLEALRVSVVDGITLSDVKIENINIPQLEKQVIVKEVQIERIEVPIIVKEIQIERVEVPVKELQIERIEVPVIIKEIVYVDRPIIIPEIKIVEIEKVIVVPKNLDTPLIVKTCMILQAMAIIGLLLTQIILKG